MNRSTLLLATVASCALAAAAQAQPGPNDGDASLHGTGATSIQNVLVQELNCIGGANVLGNANGTTTTVAEPTSLSTPAGTFDCSTQSLDPAFDAEYVGSGSGFGRQAWRNVTNQFSPVTTNVNPLGTWNTVQFAFADSSITAGDLTSYGANVASTGGAAIMIPKYVLPVAVAYNPQYGTNAAGNPMFFRVNAPGSTFGGIKMGAPLYCGIFNGTIVNWNNASFNTLNGGFTLQDTTNDTSARWSANGVPIRLVGRLDKSGTTDIFTRALATQCSGSKYTTNSEILPYDNGASSLVSFIVERSDTGLKPGGGTPAGTVNMVGREYFNTSGTGSIQISAQSAANGSTVSSNPNPATGNGSGLYLVANGSGAVARAISFGPDFSTTANPNVKLNGKVGYIGADFIANSPTGTATLHAAALTRTGSAAPALPTAANAVAAVQSIRPPQSSTSPNDGSYTGTDTRSVRDPAGGANILATRANPLAWYDVLYSTTGQASLAAPSSGYPIVGTTQFLGYTCYKPSNTTYIKEFLDWNFDNRTTDTGGATRTGIFTSTSTGLLAASNIGAMPNNWKRAIRETFLQSADPNGTDLTIRDGLTGTKCSTQPGM